MVCSLRRGGGLLCVLTLWGGLAACARPNLPEVGHSERLVTLKLVRGDFLVHCYEPEGDPKAVLVFGSGDGGWKHLEDQVARTQIQRDCRVIGWDCRAYAKELYDEAVLGEDCARMAAFGAGSIKSAATAPALPIFYGGYSTGAEQAVAAAAWSVRQKAGRSPSGLLLVAPGTRGRFGITWADLMGVTPRGAGSFSLKECAPAMGSIPVAQIHGTLDILDSTEWLSSLAGPQHLATLGETGHFFGDADERFQKTVSQEVSWLLKHAPSTP